MVKGLCKALKGHPAITALQLVSRINAIDSVRQGIISKFPTLLKGLGTIDSGYNTVLKRDARLYALVTSFTSKVTS